MKYILLMFISHFVGDYYLQTGTISKKKSHSYYYTFLHSILYVIPFYLTWMMFCKENIISFLCTSLMAWSHMFVDFVKVFYSTHREEISIIKDQILLRKLIYIVDQLCHYALIIGISLVFFNYFPDDLILNHLDSLDIYVLKLIVFFIIVFQPLHVSNRIIFCKRPMITNTMSLTSLDEKGVSLFIALVLVICKLNYLIIIGLIGITIVHYTQMKKERHRIFTGICILNLIGYYLVFCINI